MSQRLLALADAGVSIWLDDLSRERLDTGNLEELVKNQHIVGVTTNPTIFAAALADGRWYEAQVAELVAKGVGAEEAVFELTTTDVRRACDLLRDTFVATNGVDGRVSIEVSPRLAFDTEATVECARALWTAVDRPNVLVKIPATDASLPAIAEILGDGISVNVTLIFGLGRYQQVLDAYLDGLERATEKGLALGDIHSVASFFVSRLDSEVDRRLDTLGGPMELKGKVALANARLVYASYREMLASRRFTALQQRGAHPQRPLWASTRVKDPAYPDTMYVTDLVVADTVNTMPHNTLEAFADHGAVEGDKVTGRASEAKQVLDAIARAGVESDDVIATLEREGVEKFVTSWDELVDKVRVKLESPRQQSSGGVRTA
jgi:transaldolase